jgi:D-proline reductase (dithiol) PrdB
MHDNDAVMRQHAAKSPMPEFDEPAFAKAPALRNARVAIVTSAALIREGGHAWKPVDAHFETIPDDARDLKLGHLSPNFDRSGFADDINVVYPVDRLHELVDRGEIGSVASHHYSFAGNQDDSVSQVRLDSAPRCARKMLDEGVDVVLLTPV